MGEIDYQILAENILKNVVSREKAVSSTPSTVMGHGPGGLFSTPGLERPIFSAMVLPRMGLQSRLSVVPTVSTDPLFGILTGVTATTGDSEPSGVCDDPKTAGLAKLCTHTFPLGRYSRQSRVFDIDRAGKITNRAEMMDLQMLGNAIQGLTGATVPTLPGASSQAEIVRNEVAKAMFELGVSWSRDFATQIYAGNPANNTAGGGYKEFYGLDNLINTGYRDAVTGVVCPASDSIIRSAGNVDITTNPSYYVRTIANIIRNLRSLATRAGLDPVQWNIVMSFGLFYELTEIWPVSYMTYRATNIPSGSTNFVNSSDVERMRDEMRGDLYNYTGQFLLIDGQKIPVVLDDAITETQNAGSSFSSSIYFVPLTVLGGIPVTYMEHFNYNEGSIEMGNAFAGEGSYFASDNGRFLWHRKPPTNFCVQILAKTEPRLLLLTPYLAARLTDVNYTPLEHERQYDPAASYYKDGGRTEFTGAPSYYSFRTRDEQAW